MRLPNFLWGDKLEIGHLPSERAKSSAKPVFTNPILGTMPTLENFNHAEVLVSSCLAVKLREHWESCFRVKGGSVRLLASQQKVNLL